MDQRFFAKINKETNEVEGVYLHINEPTFPQDELWIETFPDGSQRKNFAGIGYTYYSEYDAFVPPKPAAKNSRVLNLKTFRWDPIKPPPEDCPEHYYYDDDYCEWISLVGPANNGGFNNADLLGFSTTTPNKLWNSEGKVVGVMRTA